MKLLSIMSHLAILYWQRHFWRILFSNSSNQIKTRTLHTKKSRQDICRRTGQSLIWLLDIENLQELSTQLLPRDLFRASSRFVWLQLCALPTHFLHICKPNQFMHLQILLLSALCGYDLLRKIFCSLYFSYFTICNFHNFACQGLRTDRW